LPPRFSFSHSFFHSETLPLLCVLIVRTCVQACTLPKTNPIFSYSVRKSPLFFFCALFHYISFPVWRICKPPVATFIFIRSPSLKSRSRAVVLLSISGQTIFTMLPSCWRFFCIFLFLASSSVVALIFVRFLSTSSTRIAFWSA